MSAIQLPFGFKLGNAVPVDFRYGPYENNILTDNDALSTAIPSAVRYKGQIIGIKSSDNSSVSPYIFKDGTDRSNLKRLVDESDLAGLSSGTTIGTSNLLNTGTYTLVYPYNGTSIPVPSGAALNKYTLYLDTTTNVFSYYNDTNLVTIEPTFSSLITVNIKDNRTFGNYEDGDIISAGTAVRDVLKNALQYNDPPVPQISVNPTSVKYGIVDQTISPTITLNKTVGTAGSITDAKLTKNTGSGETEISGIDATTTSYTDSITVSANNKTSPIVTYSYDIKDANYDFNKVQNATASIAQLPYSKLTFADLSTATITEVGDYSYNVQGTIVSSSTNNHSSIYPTSYRILRGTTEIVPNTNINTGSTKSQSVTISLHNDTYSQTTPGTISYFIKAVDTTTTETTSTAMTVTFKYKIYYGQLDSFDIDTPSFTGLSGEFVTTGTNKILTISNVNKKNVVFALPPGVTFISITTSGFNIPITPVSKSITINISANVSYDIYHVAFGVAPNSDVSYIITYSV